MNKINLIKELEERGLITQITNKEALIQRLTQGGISLYCGFDPTTDSLHVGHLVPLLCLKRFQLAGHRPIILVGGATGLIGDPSFKFEERKLNKLDIVCHWVTKIRQQIFHLLDFKNEKNSVITVNNYDWFSKMNVMTFLRDIGKNFSVNKMINREAVKQRLERHESGLSFTEFSYNLLQSYDFAMLNKKYNVELQIGGSDQWGNIISGIDLIRRLYQQKVYGLTVPLITKSDGTKFGKTEAGTVWLDHKKTSPYKFYQFWIHTADTDVYRFLKLFTFMTLEDIQSLKEEDHQLSDSSTKAQSVLAAEMTKMVHGKEALAAAQRISQSLFSRYFLQMTQADFSQLAQDGIPTIDLPIDTSLQQALVNTGLACSLRQARTLISENSVKVNGKKQVDARYCFTDADRFFGKYTLLCRGRKHHYLVRWFKNPVN